MDTITAATNANLFKLSEPEVIAAALRVVAMRQKARDADTCGFNLSPTASERRFRKEPTKIHGLQLVMETLKALCYLKQTASI